MKIEGSIQEIKDFIKEFQSKDTPLTKQQINQVKELIKTQNEEKETPVAGTTDVAVKASNIRLS